MPNKIILDRLASLTTLPQVLEFGITIARHGGYTAESISPVLGVVSVMIRNDISDGLANRSAIIDCCKAYRPYDSNQTVRAKLEEIRQWLAHHPSQDPT